MSPFVFRKDVLRDRTDSNAQRKPPGWALIVRSAGLAPLTPTTLVAQVVEAVAYAAATGVFLSGDRMLAHYVTQVLLPMADVNVDLHSGGLGMDFVVSTTSHVLEDKARQEAALRLAHAFGAPYHLLIHEVDASYTFMSTCEARGVLAISSELGGGARVSISGIEATARGPRNLLIHSGVARGTVEPPPAPTRIVTVPDYDSYVFAPSAGIYRPHYRLGATIRRGDIAGAVYSLDAPFDDSVMLRFVRDGVVWSTRGPGHVVPGDPVAVVVSPWEEEQPAPQLSPVQENRTRSRRRSERAAAPARHRPQPQS